MISDGWDRIAISLQIRVKGHDPWVSFYQSKNEQFTDLGLSHMRDNEKNALTIP